MPSTRRGGTGVQKRKRSQASGGGSTNGGRSNNTVTNNSEEAQQSSSIATEPVLRRSRRLSLIASSRSGLPVIMAQSASVIPEVVVPREQEILLLDDTASSTADIVDLTNEDPDIQLVGTHEIFHLAGDTSEGQPSVIDLTTPDADLNRQRPIDNDVIVMEAGRNEQNLNTSLTPKRPAVSCPICMDHERTIKRTGRNFVSTLCGHIFCNDCMKKVMETVQKLCPTCRKKLKQTSIHPIYI